MNIFPQTLTDNKLKTLLDVVLNQMYCVVVQDSSQQITDIMLVNGAAVREIAISMFDTTFMKADTLNDQPGYPTISVYLIS